MKKYDVVVIGAGAAGLSSAYTAKGFGKSVLIIDKNKPGGECTWFGCVPSKALINQANDVYTAKKYADFDLDTKEVMANVRKVRESVYEEESVEVLERDGIDFMKGHARFIGPKRLVVDDEEIKAKKIIICAGSSPRVPKIEGIDQVDYLTNESVFEMEDLPKSIVVLGAGAIGVELSQAMNRLGVDVTLVGRAQNILKKEDPELSSILKDKMIAEGVKILTSHEVVKVEDKMDQVKLTLKGPEGETSIEGEKILLALGRVPVVRGMDLEKSEIATGKSGIIVDDYLETTCKGIFAAGDSVGRYLFSHMANVEGIKAVQNAILPVKRRMDYSHVTWCTFSSPELATAGITEEVARKSHGDSIRVYKYDFGNIDRSKTKPGTHGLVKVVLDSKGKVLGCSVLGERAGELISEIQVLKSNNLNFSKMANVIHPYPTYAEVFNKLGKKVLVDNILNLKVVKLFRRS